MAMAINGLVVDDKDLNQRYLGTYIEVSVVGGKPEVVYVNAIGGGNMQFANGRVESQQNIHIIRDFPEVGAVNFNNTVHHIIRVPKRQWSRGLSPSVINDFCRDETVPKFSNRLSYLEADALFNRSWEDMNAGLAKIKAGQVNGFAINPRYWVKGTKKNMYLWRDRVPIGEILGKTIMFFRDCLILKQEVKDDLKGIYEIR